jgi:hypothetical protein
MGKVVVEHYNRLDPEAGEEKAALELRDKQILHPGNTALVRPFNEGIHRVDCAEDDISLSVSVYARRLENRGYILRFSPETGKVFRVYHRSRRRKEWAKDLLQKFNP